MPFWEEAAVFNADLAEFAERHGIVEAQNRISRAEVAAVNAHGKYEINACKFRDESAP
jgi:hypothetical protein